MRYEVKESKRPYMVFYPCLMKSVKGRNATVLFMSRREGMELLEGGFKEPEDDWIPADMPDEWQPFVGTITVAA